MKDQFASYFNLIFKVGLILAVLAIFFLFTGYTTEFYEPAKLTVLSVFAAIMLVVSSLRFTLTGKVTFTRTPLDLPLLILAVVAVISTLLSTSPYVSLLGNAPRYHGSLIALIVYVLLYFVVVNNLRGLRDIRQLVKLLLSAGVVLSVITLLSYAGVKVLPPPWSHGINFTPTGASFSTAAILAMLIPFVVFGVLSSREDKAGLTVKTVYGAILMLFGLTAALTGIGINFDSSWAPIFAAFSGLGLIWFYTQPRLTHQAVPFIVVPLILVAVITALSFIPPVGGAKNPLYERARSFPREVQLSFPISWKVSVSAFRDSPVWGTGPATYLFNFTNYKPIEFNNSQYWNLRFNEPFNEYLEALATKGGVGLAALLFFTAIFVSLSLRALNTLKHNHPNFTHYLIADKYNMLLPALAVSGLIFIVLLAFHTATLPMMALGLIILASFMVVYARQESQQLNLKAKDGGVKTVLLRLANLVSPLDPQAESLRIETLPSVLLTVALAVVLATFYFGSKFLLADYHHRLALNAVAQNDGITAYNRLIQAERLNPYSDLYRTDLAQTNLALANSIVVAKGPTEASPSGSLTAEDTQNIQILIQQAVNEGKSATNLSPRNPINWEILANIYRQISGVAQNAILFALDSYGRAIQNDPLNPILRLNVGGVYYTIKNYDLAIRFFTDAINLKPDYANAYFNLSVALRDKGDLQAASSTAQQTLELITDKNSQDYKLAESYLTDLKNRIASGSAQQSPITAPEQTSSGALQQERLPNVVDLPKPEKITTPSAVKKESPSPTPRPEE